MPWPDKRCALKIMGMTWYKAQNLSRHTELQKQAAITLRSALLSS
jgi:hypothetical protein